LHRVVNPQTGIDRTSRAVEIKLDITPRIGSFQKQQLGHNDICHMAAVLMTAGTKGKRSALTHSRIMIHQPMSGVQGQAADIEINFLALVNIESIIPYSLASAAVIQ